MRDKIKHFMLYRDWCSTSVISEDGLGNAPLQGWTTVREELDRMLADGEIEFDPNRLAWRLPNKGRGTQ